MSVDGRPPMGRIDASWRGEYITKTTSDERVDAESGVAPEDEQRCVFCRIVGSDGTDRERLIIHHDANVIVILNAYPYTSGHVMVMPRRHVAALSALTTDEHSALWAGVTDATQAVTRAYQPEGMNIGANLGRAAGAGIPGHLHVHIVPRWNGDTNFMTAIAEARVVPEALDVTWQRLHDAWNH